MAAWMLPAAIGGSAILGMLGGERANASNAAMSREAAMFNQQTAREQMAFQERMSSSAHQREVTDLKAAGLNPILSATSGGSSTPSGASGSMTAATMGNTMEGLAASAKETAFARIEMEAAKQGLQKGQNEIALLAEQKRATQAATAKSNMETKVMSKGIPEAELKNDVMDIVRPYVKKLKQTISTGGRNLVTPKQKTIQLRAR